MALSLCGFGGFGGCGHPMVAATQVLLVHTLAALC